MNVVTEHFEQDILVGRVIKKPSKIAKFMGPTWGPPGSYWSQIGGLRPAVAPQLMCVCDLNLDEICYVSHTASTLQQYFVSWLSKNDSLDCSRAVLQPSFSDLYPFL